jgi:hypothetical protein
MRPVEEKANLSLPLTERHATKKCEGVEAHFLTFLNIRVHKIHTSMEKLVKLIAVGAVCPCLQ